MSVAKKLVVGSIVVIAIVCVALFVKFPVSKQTTGYSIHGKIAGLSNKKIVLSLLQRGPIFYKAIDSARMEGDEFVLKGKLGEPAIALLEIVNPDGSRKWLHGTFWLENGAIDFTIDSSKPGKMTLTNAQVDKLDRKYGLFWIHNNKTRQLFKQIEEYKASHQGAITPELKAAGEQARQAHFQMVKRIVNKHSSSFYMLYAVYESRSRLSLEEVKELIPLLDIDINQYPTGRKLVTYIADRSKLTPGGIIPAIVAYDTTGARYLPAFSGHKVMLVDFWASWCKPCIETFPHLKELYKKYQPHGFGVLSISIDKQKEDWIKALGKHQLPWRNLIEHAEDPNNCGKVFCLDYIPQNLLVDSSGKILAVNVWDKELTDKIAGLCAP